MSGSIQYLSTFLMTHIWYFLFSFIIFLVIYCVTQDGRKRRVASAFLAAYIFMVLVGTVFSREESVEARVSMTPFWTYGVIARGGWKARWLIRQTILNVLMMIPFGFLVPMFLKKGKSWCTIPLGFVFSAFIELVQLLLHRGLFEIDDLIHNTLGCIIGYGIYSFLSFCKDKMVKRRKGIMGYSGKTGRKE